MHFGGNDGFFGNMDFVHALECWKISVSNTKKPTNSSAPKFSRHQLWMVHWEVREFKYQWAYLIESRILLRNILTLNCQLHYRRLRYNDSTSVHGRLSPQYQKATACLPSLPATQDKLVDTSQPVVEK
ncbi:hypothetical protein CRM22_004751 [Opisthorchis felineus]|uniref:Uncharacterized protein n=1 Tax=Opisthorchis felineus TaxID=147828 RepID=A0A4S2M045_OPIFE|nr:hypothetical protein CRM22_004751 [Opisthorchis felineus]